MTYQQAIAQAKANYQNVDLNTLKEAAAKVNEDLSIDDFVMDALLTVLESRMSDEDFCSFCETL